MNNIEALNISEDQKAKLIEMCVGLFPEYTFMDWGLLKHEKQLKYWKRDWISAKFIGWFEFCSLDLATKLYNLNNRSEISTIELYRGNIIQNYHPVDYLYKEYLFYKNE